MITESIMTFFLHVISLFVAPIFDTAYTAFGIHADQARFLIPSPLFDVVQRVMGYAVVMSPIALIWWVWRQVKA